jgi:hypothetical protein
MIDGEDVVFAGGPANLTADDFVDRPDEERGDRAIECTEPECRGKGMHEIDGELYCWSCYRRLE